MAAPRNDFQPSRNDRPRADSVRALLLLPLAAGLITAVVSRFGLTWLSSLSIPSVEDASVWLSAAAFGFTFLVEAVRVFRTR